jgi:hypothetical protein
MSDEELDFENDEHVFEVGSDIEAYCTKCKMDMTHVVVAKYEEEVRRVQCNTCGSVHNYRPPKGESEDDEESEGPTKKKTAVKKVNFEDIAGKRDFSHAKQYAFDVMLKENEALVHGTFGNGVVTEIVSPNKAEVIFPDQKRILVYNRPDLARKK